MSCTIFRFLNFHVSHLNHETFKLCLQNTLNTLKTTRVYFGVLHVEGTSSQEKRLIKSSKPVFIGPLFLKTALTFAKPVLGANN